jgi:hypothetical protein
MKAKYEAEITNPYFKKLQIWISFWSPNPQINSRRNSTVKKKIQLICLSTFWFTASHWTSPTTAINSTNPICSQQSNVGRDLTRAPLNILYGTSKPLHYDTFHILVTTGNQTALCNKQTLTLRHVPHSCNYRKPHSIMQQAGKSRIRFQIFSN